MHAWNGMPQRQAGKVWKRHAQVDGSCIGSAHKVYRNYFWADTVLDVVLN